MRLLVLVTLLAVALASVDVDSLVNERLAQRLKDMKEHETADRQAFSPQQSLQIKIAQSFFANHVKERQAEDEILNDEEDAAFLDVETLMKAPFPVDEAAEEENVHVYPAAEAETMQVNLVETDEEASRGSKGSKGGQSQKKSSQSQSKGSQSQKKGQAQKKDGKKD